MSGSESSHSQLHRLHGLSESECLEDNDGRPRAATLLPPRKFPPKSRYASLLQDRRFKSLGSLNLRAQVELPAGANEDEWLAITTIDIFNELNLLAGALADICTEKTCPCMSAGSYNFAWCDGEEFKEPAHMSAPRYIEHLLLWVEKHLADESFLPISDGMPFPLHYRETIKVIHKRLFRIYAHTFHCHFNELLEGGADAHLNHSFKRFIYFVKEFSLLEEQDLNPLQDLIAFCVGQKVDDSEASFRRS